MNGFSAAFIPADTGYVVELRPPGFFRASEDIDRAAARLLARQIRQAGFWTTPIPVDLDTGIVMDGNHRLRAALHLGLGAIPCVPLRYDDRRIAVECWHTGLALAPADIVRKVLANGRLPYKSTRHRFSPALPQIRIALTDLHSPGPGSAS